MKIKWMIIGLIMNVASNSNAQTDIFSKIIPPSPITQEYNKYINYNVTMYNGLPEISIPLYNIELNGLIIPISLSYHASGIKYRQENGDVGVGWTLNPGYRISRTIMGRADERFSMPANLFDSLNQYSNDENRKDRYLSKFIWDGYISSPTVPYPYSNDPNPKLDGEYDLFNYNLPSGSGSFIISDRVNKVIKPIEVNNYKFNYTDGNSSTSSLLASILGFTIFDENGIKYQIGEQSGNSYNIFETNSQYGGYVATAWGLEKVLTPLGDSVNFKYTEGNSGGWRDDIRSFSVMERPVCMEAGWSSIPTTNSWTDGVDESYQTFFLDEVVSTKETIKIIRNSETQFVNEINVYKDSNVLLKNIKFYYSNNSFQIFLDSLKINDATLHLTQNFSFEYYSKNISSLDTYFADQWGYYLPVSDPNYEFHQEFYNDHISMNPGVTNDIVGQLSGQYGFGPRSEANLFNPEIFSLKSISYPTGGKTSYEYESPQCLDQYNSAIQIGGLRIKKIFSNDLNNTNTLIREYFYGENQNGNGVAKLIETPNLFVDEQINILWPDGMNAAARRILNYYTTVQGDLATSGALSNLVRYPFVTEKYISTNPSIGNGKVEYKYDLQTTYLSNSYYTPKNIPCNLNLQYLNYQPPLFVNRYSIWRTPILTEKKIYSLSDNLYRLIEKEENEYSSSFSSLSGLKVRPFASMENYLPNLTGFSSPYNFLNSFYKYGEYFIESGYTLLTQKKVTNFSSVGDSSVFLTKYFYNPKNQLSKTKIYNSTCIQEYENSYITDLQNLVINHPLKLMQEKNILDLIIEKRLFKMDKDETNRRLISSQFTSYDTDLPNPSKNFSIKLSAPVNNFSQVAVVNGQISKDSRYTIDESFNQYDLKGNLLDYNNEGNFNTAFIWDYKRDYPVARVSNATFNDIAATSFEAEGKGNWTFSGTPSTAGGSITGKQSYSLSSGNISKSGLTSSKKYIVSGWKNGTVSITGGTLSNLVIGKTINGWTYQEVTITAATTVTVSGSGYIDELRLYPSDAQITTYTYEPLIGMTSQSDLNNRITYYEYDGLGRLTVVRDQEKNILKKFDYYYASQNGSTGQSTYPNDLKSQSFTRNNCSTGLVGSTVVYTVPAGTYQSTISVADANTQAQNDINLNGQNYANTNGTCTVPTIYARIELVNVYNDVDYTSADVYIRFYSNSTCTTPYSVSNLNVNYKSVKQVCGGSAFTNNYTQNCTGTSVYLGNKIIDRDDGLHCDSTTYSVSTGTGYTAK